MRRRRGTVFQLAIYLAARTSSKGEAAAMEIEQAVPSANPSSRFISVRLYLCRRSTFHRSVKPSRAPHQQCGVTATSPGSITKGYELQSGTNCIRHALLAKLLLPVFLSTAEACESDIRTYLDTCSEGHILASSAGILLKVQTECTLHLGALRTIDTS